MGSNGPDDDHLIGRNMLSIWHFYGNKRILLCWRIIFYVLRLSIVSRRRNCSHWNILITEPTRCTNFSNLLLEWNSTCFGQSLCPSSGCTHSNRYLSYRFCWLHVSRILIPLTSSQQNLYNIYLYNIYLLLCVQCWTPDVGQRDCPKHVEFHSENKFEKLVYIVGFVIRIYIDARSSECQIRAETFFPVRNVC